MFLVWDTMNQRRAHLFILLGALLVGSLAHISTASATSNLGACTTIGQSKKVAKVNYVCTKSGKQKVWTRVSTTSATTVAPEKYEGPSTASGNVNDCKLVENSPERNRWGAIFAAFPPIGGNFEPTGTFKVALIPIDWADLPGEANPLNRATDQISLFNEWYDTASEGKVKFIWSTYDKYVRVPGSALDFKQARSGAGTLSQMQRSRPQILTLTSQVYEPSISFHRKANGSLSRVHRRSRT